MLTGEIILNMLEEHMSEIKKFGVKNIGVFGSYSQEKQTSGSDVDILVEFNKGQKTFDHYMELKFFLEALFGREVDLVIAETIKPELKQVIMGSVKYAKGA